MPLIREALDSGQSVRFYPRGISMLPMLRQDIDSVVLSPVKGRLKKYDLPLYRRDDGKYVLHRVIAVSDTYTCMGDNQFVPEAGLRQDQMIAVVTALFRGERTISVSSRSYRLYCVLWTGSAQLRNLYRRVKNRLKRILQRRK